jgi:hypothetical protein
LVVVDEDIFLEFVVADLFQLHAVRSADASWPLGTFGSADLGGFDLPGVRFAALGCVGSGLMLVAR